VSKARCPTSGPHRTAVQRLGIKHGLILAGVDGNGGGLVGAFLGQRSGRHLAIGFHAFFDLGALKTRAWTPRFSHHRCRRVGLGGHAPGERGELHGFQESDELFAIDIAHQR
jgi:hypothetical protein